MSASGGLGITDLFEIDPTHTTITVAGKFTLDEKVKTTPTSQSLVCETIKYDPDITTFLEDNVAEGSSDQAETVLLETSAERKTSSSSGAQQFITFSYGAVVNHGGVDKVPVIVGVGPLSSDSGDVDIEANKFYRPKFQVDFSPALKEITIDNDCWDSDLVTPPADGSEKKFPRNARKRTYWLPKAT